MTESDFFAALRDHLPFYTLTIIHGAPSSTPPYAVELFARKASYRCAGFSLSECFSSILDALPIRAVPATQTFYEVSGPIDVTPPAPESKRGKTSSK